MKETGVVRRIDELGRVVIPKEIRRTMRIREGEEMEVFVADDECVVLKKYSPLVAQLELFREYQTILSRETSADVIICDRDNVVASSAKEDVGKRISRRLWEAVEARVPTAEVFAVADESPDCKEMLTVPLLSRGDALGALIVRSKTRGLDSYKKLIETAGQFLSLAI